MGMEEKHLYIYPIYFNPNLSRAQGRKYPKECCKLVSVHELCQFIIRYRRQHQISDNELRVSVEQKNHPKTSNIRCSKSDYGRLRVDYSKNFSKCNIIDLLKTKMLDKKVEQKPTRFVRKRKDKKSK